MQTFWIQEAAITASSIRDSVHDPAQARLHGNGAWMPLIQDANQFLQIDFENEANVSAVAIQGHPTNDFWVSKYSLSFSKDGKLWDDISEVLLMRSTKYGCLSVVLNFLLFFCLCSCFFGHWKGAILLGIGIGTDRPTMSICVVSAEMGQKIGLHLFPVVQRL